MERKIKYWMFENKHKKCGIDRRKDNKMLIIDHSQ